MIIHPLDTLTDEEKKYVQDFKQFCKEKGVPVPERDDDIFRFL